MFNSGFNSLYPYQSLGAKQGLFSLLKGKINWSSLLSNTQKTLNIINQAIPVFYQVKPLWNNTKTVFRIMGALKEDDKKPTNNFNYNQNKARKDSTYTNINNTFQNDNTPSFFL